MVWELEPEMIVVLPPSSWPAAETRWAYTSFWPLILESNQTTRYSPSVLL
ncbi:MAG: hypothetical protein ACYSUA_15760 [Planctomycetota bacterium]